MPDEDQGTIFADISLPPGASLERTTAITDEVNRIGLVFPTSVTGQVLRDKALSMAMVPTTPWIVQLKELQGVGILDAI